MLTKKIRETVEALINATRENFLTWYYSFETGIYRCRIGEFNVSIKKDFTKQHKDIIKVCLFITTADRIICEEEFEENFLLAKANYYDQLHADIWGQDCAKIILLLNLVVENEKKNRVYSSDSDSDLQKLINNIKDKK